MFTALTHDELAVFVIAIYISFPLIIRLFANHHHRKRGNRHTDRASIAIAHRRISCSSDQKGITALCGEFGLFFPLPGWADMQHKLLVIVVEWVVSELRYRALCGFIRNVNNSAFLLRNSRCDREQLFCRETEKTTSLTALCTVNLVCVVLLSVIQFSPNK